jgi:AraC-like DNA-binding protein
LIRAASLKGYPQLARSVGLDSARMLRAVGLDPAMVADPDSRYPVKALVELMELSASMANIEDFGLRLSELREFTIFGPVSLVAREEPFARGALGVFIGNLHLHNEALRIDLSEAEGLATLALDLDLGELMAIRQSIELAVAMLYRILARLLGFQWQAELVAFAHARPRGATAHRRMFGDRIEFDHDFTGIVCLSADLDRPNPMANPAFRRYAQQYLHLIDRPKSATMRDQVRQLILAMLPAGRCSLKTIAHNLGIDRQTVHRHLVASGTTYTALLDEVRSELASRYVVEGDRGLAEIGEVLGFSESSAFSRWFRKKFGVSAKAWRAKQHAIAPRES